MAKAELKPKPVAKPAAQPVTEPVKETREAKLERLANARVSKTIKAISLVGNLAAYKPTEPEADAILGALTAALQHVAQRLAGVKTTVGPFSLRTYKSQ
jgi:hypothetical protein